MIDQATFDEGIRLTVLGMGTAFALLFALGLVISILGRIVGPESRWSRRDKSASPGPSDEQRGKALAAVVAVSALAEKADGAGAAT